MFGTTEHVKL